MVFTSYGQSARKRENYVVARDSVPAVQPETNVRFSGNYGFLPRGWRPASRFCPGCFIQIVHKLHKIIYFFGCSCFLCPQRV